MSLDQAVWVIGILGFLLVIFMGRCEYWKAKYETIREETEDSGWESEAKFWRHHFNKDAAEYADYSS